MDHSRTVILLHFKLSWNSHAKPLLNCKTILRKCFLLRRWLYPLAMVTLCGQLEALEAWEGSHRESYGRDTNSKHLVHPKLSLFSLFFQFLFVIFDCFKCDMLVTCHVYELRKPLHLFAACFTTSGGHPLVSMLLFPTPHVRRNDVQNGHVLARWF